MSSCCPVGDGKVFNKTMKLITDSKYTVELFVSDFCVLFGEFCQQSGEINAKTTCSLEPTHKTRKTSWSTHTHTVCLNGLGVLKDSFYNNQSNKTEKHNFGKIKNGFHSVYKYVGSNVWAKTQNVSSTSFSCHSSEKPQMFAFEFASRKTTLSYQILPRLTGSIQTNTRFPFQTCSWSRSANKINTRSDGVTRAFTNSFNSGPEWQPVAAAARCRRWQVPPPLAAWKQQIRAAAIKTWAVLRDRERKPDTGNNQTKWNSSCSVSSAETPLSHSADNNAQGWDNRKCQLIRQREKQRERQRESVMASSLFTYRLIEKKKRPLCPRNKKEFGVYTSVSPEQIFFVQVAFVSRKCRKKYHERRQIHHFLNLSSITLPLICLDWVTSRGEFV